MIWSNLEASATKHLAFVTFDNISSSTTITQNVPYLLVVSREYRKMLYRAYTGRIFPYSLLLITRKQVWCQSMLLAMIAGSWFSRFHV